MTSTQVYKNEAKVLNNLDIANNFISRLVGLLNRRSLDDGNGLLLVACNQVHSIGMRFNIDVIFLDSHRKVLKVVNDFPAFRVTGCKDAYYTMEVKSGEAEKMGVKKGDYLKWAN